MHNEIGSAAGKIWHTLEGEREIVLTRLLKKTGLPSKFFYMGLGWLAREDKLQFRFEKHILYISLKR
jgi:hypothetical protein